MTSTTSDVTILVAIIALVGVTFSALVSIFNSSRSTYINSVTVERSKWIDKLRTNLADFVSEISFLNYEETVEKDFLCSKEVSARVKVVQRLASVIRLQLNPLGGIDRNSTGLRLSIPKPNPRYRVKAWREPHMWAWGQWVSIGDLFRRGPPVFENVNPKSE